ncbi:MAG: pentapeptide repeat-containing protein [Saprospiraceae bacterium]|nr:pentapeptide repeat-containing protein [Saprospiraceae bacterium]
MQEKDKLRQLEQENASLRSALRAAETAKPKRSTSIWPWLKRATTSAILGKNLKQSINQLYTELPRNVQQDTMAEVTANLLHRLTRIGIFALVVGLVPLLILLTQTWILDNQNEKLEHQNELISSQNLLLDQQINLEEGNRRSSYVFLMSNIMDKIDEELKNTRNGRRQLSEEIIGRIVSLSHAFRPYRYLENNRLIPTPLSPERGQLLYALVNSRLDLPTYDDIFAKANFSYSDLPRANFAGAYLKGINLSYANINHGNFKDAILDGANFQQSQLDYAIFDNTLMNEANFRQANLEHSQWYNVLAQGISLAMANVRAGFFNGDFSNAELEGIILHDATLNYIVLRNAFFFNSNWVNRMAQYNLKGSFSLTDNYNIEQDYIFDSGRNIQDTVFRLIPRNDTPQLQFSICESLVLNLIRSAPALQKLDQELRQQGDRSKYELQSSPYLLAEEGLQDSLFTFSRSGQDTTQFDQVLWVKFDPEDGRLWTISPAAGEITIHKYQKEMYDNFLQNCQ